MDSTLTIDNLSVGYGRKGLALDGVSLSVPSGSIVALLGANGAGKTTLIRAISGMLGFYNGQVTQGQATFAGQSLLGKESHHLVRLGMALVPEGRMVFKQLSVEDNLRVGAATVPRKQAQERMDSIYEMFPRLRERQNQAAGWLSGGEQQMLAIGRALVSGPRILLIDETSLGLAPLIVESIYKQLGVISATLGTSMLVVEQNASIALEFATTAYVLDRGRITLSGTSGQVAASDAVREAYLGSGSDGLVAGVEAMQ